MEGMLFVVPLILEIDAGAGVEERELAETVGENVEGKLDGLENLVVRLEGDLGAVLVQSCRSS